MQSVFRTFVVICVLVMAVNSAKTLLKPSFFPYCTTKDRCQPACTCEVYPNCVILTMDETIRYGILYYHNQIRDIQSMAEPQPAGMTMLEYDMELEEISICWAARCDDEYSECFITSKFAETSQSVVQLILDVNQEPNVFLWMQVMNEWLGQVRTLSAEIIASLPAGPQGEMLNNYVQLMSDRILAVGCAWSQLDNVLTMVCTYGPRGPLQGEPVYRVGYPCTACPFGYACDFTKPFEQLCKLKIYSDMGTPPRPPPAPTPSRPPYPIPTSPEYPTQTPDDFLPPIPQEPDWTPQPPPLPHNPTEETTGPTATPSTPELPTFPNPHFPTDPPLRMALKPTFYPYCLSLNVCQEACKCEKAPDCTIIPMDAYTRNEILLYHNKMRYYQTTSHPQPARLTLLEYDIDLEDVSSCWAATCQYEYSDCFLTPNFTETSQTIAHILLEETENPDIALFQSIMQGWIESLPIDLTYRASNDMEDHNIAQILSDQILYLGCAWSLSGNSVTLVCTYGPRGPMPGEIIYTIGEVCTKCPAGYTCYEVKPFETLCKRINEKLDLRESEDDIEIIQVEEKHNQSKVSVKQVGTVARAAITARTNTTVKPKPKSKTLYYVFLSIFIAVVVFFVSFGAYLYFTAK